MIEAPSTTAEIQRPRMNGSDVVLAIRVVKTEQADSKLKRKTADSDEM
jgi:hypothetical protein